MEVKETGDRTRNTAEHGNLTYKPKQTMFHEMFIKTSVQVDIQLPGDKKIPRISGCEKTPNGQVILCDVNNSNLKLLCSAFIVKDVFDLQSPPWDVSVINDSLALISLPRSSQLQYIHMEPILKSGRVIQLDKGCWGIKVSEEHIYVTLHNNPGDGEVRVIDMNGNLKKKVDIKINSGVSCMFQSPEYLTRSTKTGKMYISDWETSTVTCLMPDGSIVYQYKDNDLRGPSGVCIDGEDNVIVCSELSDSVNIVTASGQKYGCLLPPNNGIMKPVAVAFRHTDDTLVVGCFDHNKLFVYKMT